MKKAILYINQFFGQIGGEDKADFAPVINEGLVGPAMQLDKVLEEAEVTHTVICGDNFIGSNQEEAVNTILGYLEGLEFDIFFAGPAFQAGRYGAACGHICKAVKEKFGVPVITSMHIENPGVEMFKKEMYVFEGGHSAAKMRADIKAMAKLGDKLLRGEESLGAEVEGYYARGIRHQVWREDEVPATERVIDMLLKKVHGEEYVSELPIPKMDRVEIAPAIKDLGKAKIAVLNTGGIVPIDNPDRIQSASATRWGRYDVEGCNDLEGGVYKTIHAGFDPAAADADPDVIVPIDSLRLYEKEGKIGSLHNYFYTTVGTGTTQAEATRMAQEIVPLLQEDNVDGVIMVSTWGTCTRCGATMVKEIERAGFPVVQMANLVPVAKTVGANKIVPTISIPYPLGDPGTTKEEQWKLRHHRVGVALDALATDVQEQTIFRVQI